MSTWAVYGWTGVIVANWLVIGYMFLWVRRDLDSSRVPRASWLVPAAVHEDVDGDGDVRGELDELSLRR